MPVSKSLEVYKQRNKQYFPRQITVEDCCEISFAVNKVVTEDCSSLVSPKAGSTKIINQSSKKSMGSSHRHDQISMSCRSVSSTESMRGSKSIKMRQNRPNMIMSHTAASREREKVARLRLMSKENKDRQVIGKQSLKRYKGASPTNLKLPRPPMHSQLSFKTNKIATQILTKKIIPRVLFTVPPQMPTIEDDDIPHHLPTTTNFSCASKSRLLECSQKKGVSLKQYQSI